MSESVRLGAQGVAETASAMVRAACSTSAKMTASRLPFSDAMGGVLGCCGTTATTVSRPRGGLLSLILRPRWSCRHVAPAPPRTQEGDQRLKRVTDGSKAHGPADRHGHRYPRHRQHQGSRPGAARCLVAKLAQHRRRRRPAARGHAD